MEGLEVFAFERVDADRGGLARGPKLIPVAEGFQFAGLDGGGIVVALLESLEGLLALEFELVGLEPGLGQHLAQERQAFWQILGEEIQADHAEVVTDGRSHLRRQKSQAFVQGLCRLGGGSAPHQQSAGERGQALLPHRVEVGAGAHQNGDRHQRQFPIRNDIRHGSGLQGHPVLAGVRRLVVQGRKLQGLRPRWDGRKSVRRQRHSQGEERQVPNQHRETILSG